MWYQFLRKGLDTRFRFGNNFARLGKIDSTKKEITYLRPEASWRKMLLKQPSTSNVSFTNGVDRNGYTTFTDYHRAKWKPDRDYIRIKNLEFLIDSGTLTPGLYPLYFWANPDAMFETSFKDQIYEKPYINTHLIEYDFAINVHFTDIGFSCWHYNDLISTTPLTTKAWMHSKDVKLYLTNSMKASIFD
ncbi:uncharacterized protein KD926_003160 [Aspergillus affinis]|uniref:uncharacterized protein n=1 Tax=Aspergillus affinis TaxID=1070780 RepID=UPI0022FEAE3B|nr:uncharacterized protein KD926_003160 [Aspergillus affinis]KAI9035649.1 hypothetical protein KD926_003160 [Aspergillus affinis]